MSAEDQAMPVGHVGWSPDFKTSAVRQDWEGGYPPFTVFTEQPRSPENPEKSAAVAIRAAIVAARLAKRGATDKRRLNAALLCLEDALARLEVE